MKPHIKEIIDAMDPTLRSQAEAAAAEAGKTLEIVIADCLSDQLDDEQLDKISGGLLTMDSSQGSFIKAEIYRSMIIKST